MSIGMCGYRRFLSLAVLATIAAGCCGGDRPTLGRVSGAVTLDEKPLRGAAVVFSPVEGSLDKPRPRVGKGEDADNFYIRVVNCHLGVFRRIGVRHELFCCRKSLIIQIANRNHVPAGGGGQGFQVAGTDPTQSDNPDVISSLCGHGGPILVSCLKNRAVVSSRARRTSAASRRGRTP